MILYITRTRQPLRQSRYLLLPLLLIGVITWLAIPAAGGRPRLEGGLSQALRVGSLTNSDQLALSSVGQTQAAPFVDHASIWIGSVKRGPMILQVRGLGVLTPGDGGRLKAELGIFEPQSRNIESGQPVTLDTRTGVIPGSVVGISPQVTNGQVTVEVSLEGDLPTNIKAGLPVDGMIEVGRREAILFVGRPVRSEADSTTSIFKLEDNGRTATRVRVRFGQISVNTIEIVEGLNVGDEVILTDMSDYEGVTTIRLN